MKKYFWILLPAVALATIGCAPPDDPGVIHVQRTKDLPGRLKENAREDREVGEVTKPNREVGEVTKRNAEEVTKKAKVDEVTKRNAVAEADAKGRVAEGDTARPAEPTKRSA